MEELPNYTMADVAEHNTEADCWIILDERVYDITRFIHTHPGGAGPIVNMAGKDATDVFANYHAARVCVHRPPCAAPACLCTRAHFGRACAHSSSARSPRLLPFRNRAAYA